MQENSNKNVENEGSAPAGSSLNKEEGFSIQFRIWMLVLIIALLGFDQFTKHLVMENMAQGENITVLEDWFYITHIQNPGVAFGMLSDLPEAYRVPVLTIMAAIAMTLVIFYSLRLRKSEWLSQVSLHMIFAGAVGNQLDRFFHGSVTDFLLFRHGDWSFPAFNIADSAIVVGVCFLLIDTLFPAIAGKKEEKLKESNIPVDTAESEAGSGSNS
jgi:signal peptidase II